MSWSDNNNNNPWGSPGSNGGGSGPNIDQVIRDAQNKIKKFLPGSFFGKLGPLFHFNCITFDLVGKWVL